jgi:hypothetical protein
VAVGAVGGLADSGVVVRLTRGRLWIGMLATLLVGIVALNVMALSFTASESDAGRQADALRRDNSALKAEIAKLTASPEVSRTADKLGLYAPTPDAIGYLRPSAGDAAAAAKRLRDGDLSSSGYVAPVVAAAPVVTATPTTTTTTPEPTATTVAPTTETAPTTDTATAAAPAAAATTAAASASTTDGGALSTP